MEMEMASDALPERNQELHKAAIQIAAILPHNLAGALTVLEMAREQVIEFFTSSSA